MNGSMKFRFLLLIVCLGFSSGVLASDPPAILVFGDSLSAGYGIDHSRSWVSLLAQRLERENFPHRVVNASISGETTAGGLSRLPAALDSYRPAIVILELGANDGLRGLPLLHLRANLDKLIDLSKKSGARVLLIGMKLPPNYGDRYAQGFEDIYTQLAKKQRTARVPFLLDGVADRRELMQADNVHPTAEAQPRLLDNVWPHLLPLLKDRR
jgi:acyl-CoA thioesterase-1